METLVSQEAEGSVGTRYWTKWPNAGLTWIQSPNSSQFMLCFSLRRSFNDALSLSFHIEESFRSGYLPVWSRHYPFFIKY